MGAKKVRINGVTATAPDGTERTGLSVLARFKFSAQLTIRDVASLYGHSGRIDHARNIAKFFVATGFCEFKKQQYGQSVYLVLSPKWTDWKEAYTAWKAAWEPPKPAPKPERITKAMKVSILKVIEAQGEASVETIAQQLKQAEVEIGAETLANAIDLMVADGQILAIEKSKATFFAPAEKKAKQPKPRSVKQQLESLAARIQKTSDRRDELLAKAALLEEEINRLTQLIPVIQGQEMRLEVLQGEAEDYRELSA